MPQYIGMSSTSGKERKRLLTTVSPAPFRSLFQTLFYSLLIHLASPNSICLLFPLVMFSSHWFFSNLATDENSKEANHFHVWLTLGNNQQQRKKVMNWVITHILLLKVTKGSWKWQHPLNTYYNAPVAQERVKVHDKLTFPDGCGQRRYNIPPSSHWFWAEQPILVFLFNFCDFFFPGYF